jgi:DNA-binding protein Fis
MRVSHDNKNQAAKLLGIHRTALYKKMKKFSIPLKSGAKDHKYV